MAFADYLVWQILPLLVAVTATIVIAIWLLVLDFNHKAHRAFAFLLIVMSVTRLANGLVQVSPTVRGAMFWAAIVSYGAILYIFAELRLIGVHPRIRPILGHPVGLAALAGVATAVLVAFARDHSLFFSIAAAGEPGFAYGNSAVIADTGPFTMFLALGTLGFVLVGYVFARDYARSPKGRAHHSSMLIAFAFIFVAVSRGASFLVAVLADAGGIVSERAGGTWWLANVAVEGALTSALGLAAAIYLLRAIASSNHGRKGAATIGSLLVVALALGIYEGLARPGSASSLVLYGAARIFMPITIAYAIVRHRLFGIDLKARRAVQGGTVAAAFVAVFFAVSEGAQAIFEDQLGSSLAGVGAAALLVFAIAPLQRFARNLADVAVPDAKPVAAMSDREKLAMYADIAAVSWADGRLTPKDREVLDIAMERLGVSADDAKRLELSAARGVA